MSELTPTAGGSGNRYMQMSDEELARLIFRDSVIRQACEFVVQMIVARRRIGQHNVACEVAIQGRQVTAAYSREKFGTCMLPPTKAADG